MKKPILALTFAALTVAVWAGPPIVTLVVHLQDGGEIQIITSATPTVRAYNFVLESTTDLVVWTATGTNALSYNSTTGNLMGTNLVQITNHMTFYRVEAVAK